MKDGQKQLDYQQNSDDFAQRFAGFSFMLHSKKTGVLTPEKRAHPSVGMLFLHLHRIHIALRTKSYKESSRFCKYIWKDIFSLEKFFEGQRCGFEKTGIVYSNSFVVQLDPVTKAAHYNENKDVVLP